MLRGHGSPVKVVVLGDEGAGKTSLITSAATESFPDHPPPVLPHTRLPPEATPDYVPMIIMDTSSREEERAGLEAACLSADVALLVFASDSRPALERIGSHWMEELRRLQVTVPVILVGTKSDLKKSDWDLQQAVVGVMNSYKEIETCLECSAKNLVFVAEVFYYAVKAVMHPTAPLFDPATQTLKPRCVNALKRIFMLCDQNEDDALDDDELNAFQVRCFNAPLQPEELAGVKKVVQDKMPSGVDGRGLTLSGFLFLHALFIERGRLETTWAVLRKFGYNDSLRISEQLLDETSFTHSPDQVVELTHHSRCFLGRRFRRFDRERLGALSPSQLDEAFSTAPGSLWADERFDSLLVQSSPDGLTEEGWMAKWAFTTAADPRAALEWLMYLGYDKEASAAFTVSRPRRLERKAAAASPTGGSAPSRSVLKGLVFGGSGAGKTTLLARLVGLPGDFPAASVQPGICDAAGHIAVNSKGGPADIRLYEDLSRPEAARGDKQAVLLLREISESSAAKLLRSSAAADVALAEADVAVFIFDCTSLTSWRTAHRLMLAVAQAAGDVLPCVLVAAKDDLGISNDVSQQCSTAVAELKLPAPLPLEPSDDTSDGSHVALWSRLIAAAQHDTGAHIPHTPSLKAAQQRQRVLRRAVLYGAAACVMGACGYGGWLWWHQSSNGGSGDSVRSSTAVTSRP